MTMAGLLNYAKQHQPLKNLVVLRGCFAAINADKINILRKQYDAFLEEDKKRKERNEHILEKLDKIRLSNTIVRYKLNINIDQRVTFSGVGEAPIKTYIQPQTNKQPPVINSVRKYKEALITPALDALAKPMDEAYIINEISKNYILIPKLKSKINDDYISRAIKQDYNNDNDWKSKYSILDKLKQNEKEETIDYSALNNRSVDFSDDIPSREPKCRVGDEGIGIPPTREIDLDYTYAKTGVSNPLKCLEDKAEVKLNNYIVKAEKDETITSERQPDPSPKSMATDSRELKLNPELTKVSKNVAHNNVMGATRGQHQIQPSGDTAGYTNPVPDHELSSFKKISDQRNDPTYNDKHENEDTEKVSPLSHDISHVEVIDPIKPTLQERNENIGDSEKLEYPIDIINVPDFTPADNVTLVDGVNINPDGHDVQEAYLASTQHNVSDPAASNEQAYLPGASNFPGGDQNVSDPTVPFDQAYLPEANYSSEQYVSEPTVTTEQAHLPHPNQYVLEQPVPAEQTYSEPVEEHKDNVPENPEQLITSDPDVVDAMASEIEAFETEQNQMFYSEQANYQNYTQGAVGDVSNPENTGYDPALYYGGVQQEAAYPVEINEHEETQQRYDPNYEQQYGGKAEEQHYAEQQNYAESQQYAEEQQYGEQQQYVDQQQYGDQQQYVDQQQYGDQQQYVDQQQYGEQQHYDEQQPYMEQPQYGEQLPSELGMISTALGYDQGQNDGVSEQQVVKEIEQQLDDEELTVPNQEANTGDVVDESMLYTQNASNVVPAES